MMSQTYALLRDRESHLAPLVQTVELLGEIPITPEACQQLGKAIGLRLRSLGLTEAVRTIRNRYPCTFAVFLVAQGVHGYDGRAGYWPGVGQAIGRSLNPAWARELGRLFEKILADLDLPLFPDLGGRRYVDLILMHGGIPNYCLDDFFNNMLRPAVTRDFYADMPVEELIDEWLLRASGRYFVDKPVLRFLEFGGRVAEDFVERSRELAREFLDAGQVSLAEEVGLPQRVVEAFHQWAVRRDGFNLSKGKVGRRTSLRLRKPEILLDPWGEGITLELPPQQIPVTLSQAEIVWQVRAGTKDFEIPVRIRRVGYDLRTTAESLLLETPTEIYEVSLWIDGQPRRTWRYHGPDGERPLLAFDAGRGALLRRAPSLPARHLWLLYPRGARLDIIGDARLLEEFPRLPWGWSTFQGQAWDISQATQLIFRYRDKASTIAVRPDERARRPSLVGGDMFPAPPSGPTTIPLYLGAPPAVRVPLVGRTSMEEELKRWRLTLFCKWTAYPNRNLSIPLSELRLHLKEATGAVELPLNISPLLGKAPYGNFVLRLRGPLGRDAELPLRVLPPLTITGHEKLYLPNPQTGPPPVTLHFETEPRTRIELQSEEDDDRLLQVDKQETRWIHRLQTAPETTLLELNVIKSLPDNSEEVRVPLRIPIRRLRWALQDGTGDDPLPKLLNGQLIVRPVEALLQAESPVLIVELPGVDAENLSRQGIVHRISHLFWEVVPVEEAERDCYRCTHCRSVFHINLRGVCPSYSCQGNLEPLDASAPGWVQNHYRYLYQNMKPIPFSAQEHTAQWTSHQAARVQERFIQGELNALSCSTTFELGVDVGELQAVLMRNMPPTTANYVQRAGRAGRRTDSAAFALTYAQRRSHDLTHYARPERIVAGKIRPPSVVVANEKIVRRHVHSVLFAAFFRRIYQEQGRYFQSVGDFFDPEDGSPTGPELLRQYAAERPTEVLETLRRIVPRPLHEELDIEGWGWLNRLWSENTEQTSEEVPILDAAAREVTEDLALFRRLEEEAARERNYRRSQHFQRAARTVQKRSLLGFLGSRNVLPKYGFPTDVVELRTNYVDLPEAGQVELQRDLRIALSEYAPGGEVVAAKRIWVSGGIYKRPGRDWPTYYYAVCPECGHFHRSLESLPDTCSVCGGNVYGWPRLYGTYIIPEFGFIVARNEPRPSSQARPWRLYSSRVYFADYALPLKEGQESPEIPLEPVSHLSNASVQLWKRYSRYGKLALVNPGLAGRGFRICTVCGFAEPTPEMPVGRRRRSRKSKAHVNPRTGRPCTGWIETHHLGHEFITDVLELRFAGWLASNTDYNLWWSVLFALLEGASQTLGIRRDDLDGTLYRHRDSPIPALVLLDNVPGGAGHVRRIADELAPTFRAAWERVAHCECGEETSCYECLRNFRNQPYHDQLQRGLARDFLGGALGSEF